MREKLKVIINEVINEVLPDKAVKNKLKELNVQSEVRLVSIGKAAWRMPQKKFWEIELKKA